MIAPWFSGQTELVMEIAGDGGIPDVDMPNIVFIMADDLGYGDLSCYGAQQVRTPNIDKLASEGIRFTDAHTPSAVCTPTRYGVLTGRYCWRSALKEGVLFGESAPLIEKQRTTVAKLLQNSGYRTFAVGKWHLGLGWHWTADGQIDFTKPISHGPCDLGFDSFFGIPASLDMQPYCFIRNNQTVGIPSEEKYPLEQCQREGLMVPGWKDNEVNATLTQEAVARIEEHVQADGDQPFFLYMALTGPHTPWTPAGFAVGQSSVGLRGDMIWEADWTVGEIVNTLEKLGIRKNTLVIFTSDNGPDSREIDEKAMYQHDNTAGLKGRKADIWDGGHRVPFVASWPQGIPQNVVSDEIIELTDLLATAAVLVGAELPPDAGPDSYNILPALRGQSLDRPIREAVVHHSLDGMFSIRQGPWKLCLGLGSGGFTSPQRLPQNPGEPAGQLYNLDDDRAEQRNVYLEYPSIVERLTQILEEYQAQGYSRK